MSFQCPRCGKRVETLVPLDSIKYNYQGTITRACVECANSMMTAGEFAPSGSAERMMRAKRITDKQRREITAARLKQWGIRIAWGLVLFAAGWFVWTRYLK